MDISVLILGFAQQYPIVASIVFVMGLARLVNKPIFAIAHSIVEATPSDSDDKVLAEVEASKIYKGVSFVLDYVGSIKLPKKS